MWYFSEIDVLLQSYRLDVAGATGTLDMTSLQATYSTLFSLEEDIAAFTPALTNAVINISMDLSIGELLGLWRFKRLPTGYLDFKIASFYIFFNFLVFA